MQTSQYNCTYQTKYNKHIYIRSNEHKIKELKKSQSLKNKG